MEGLLERFDFALLLNWIKKTTTLSISLLENIQAATDVVDFVYFSKASFFDNSNYVHYHNTDDHDG